MQQINELFQSMGIDADVYSFGEETFTADEIKETIRREMNAIAGDYHAYEQNKHTIFKLVEVAVDEAVKNGAIASGAICYTISPIHTLDSYVELAKNMQSLGCQTIAIKDMAGILSPAEAYKLVSSLKEAVDLPLVLHTHCTTGLGFMTCLKAVEAGVDVIDTAISTMSGGTSQPATETIHDALTGLGYETGLNRDTLKEVNDHFKPLRDQYLSSGLLKAKALVTDTDALTYKVPGGMLSNMMANLEDMNALDRMEEALLEIPQVRKDMGYPPLVTPTSQIVGTQAVLNVLSGERYKMVTKETKGMLRGEYGKLPAPVNEEVRKKAIEEMGAKVFYAAVSQEDDGIHLSGSRALGIVASGESIEEAEKVAAHAVFGQQKKQQQSNILNRNMFQDGCVQLAHPLFLQVAYRGISFFYIVFI